MVNNYLNLLLGDKSSGEINGLLSKETKSVIISWFKTKNVLIEGTAKNIFTLLQKELNKSKELQVAFSNELYPYLQHGLKPVYNKIEDVLTLESLNAFKWKNFSDKKLYVKGLIDKCDENIIDKFYSKLLDSTVSSIDIHGSTFDIYDFSKLDKKSQKSMTLYHLATKLLLKGPEHFQGGKKEFMKTLRETLSELLVKVQKVRDIDNDIFKQLMYYEMDPVTYMIGVAYLDNNENITYNDIRGKMNDLDEDEQTTLDELYSYFSSNNPKTESYYAKIFGYGQSQREENSNVYTNNIQVPIEEIGVSTKKDIIIPEAVIEKFQLTFNPLVHNVTSGQLIESSKEVARSSYQMLFGAADSFLSKIGISSPQGKPSIESAKMSAFTTQEDNFPNNKKVNTLYHERDSVDLSEQELGILAQIIKSDQETFGLKSKEYKLYSRGFKKPFPSGRSDWYGYFENNLGFEGMHLVLHRNKQDIQQKKIVFSSGESLGIHEHLYYYIQLQYYFVHKKFLPKSLVYTNLYHELNLLNQPTDLFDISVSEKQYEQLIKNIIRPFSKEAQKNQSRVVRESVVFGGLPGTGKSQFLQTLLTKKEYMYNGQSLHLNANVVSININEFLGMISSNSFFVQRVYQNTQLPTLLIIEDLDTILTDEEEVGSSIVQAITNFLQGVGETPVTLITSTNFLHRFPERLWRPGRFNRMIPFYLELTDQEFAGIIEQHLKKNNLELSRMGLMQKYKEERMSYFSASYIAKVIKSLATSQDFISYTGGANLTQQTESEKEKLLLSVLDSMIIPLEDIKKSNKLYTETVANISGKIKSRIGFASKRYS